MSTHITIESEAFKRRHLLTLLAIILLVGLVGYGYFSFHKRLTMAEKKNELTAIATQKADQIIQWRRERLGDALSVSSNKVLAARLKDYLDGRGPQTVPEEFRIWMEGLRKSYDYRSAALFRTDGTLLASAVDAGDRLAIYYPRLVQEAVRKNEPFFSDFHRDDPTGSIHLNLLVPIGYKSGNNKMQTIAVMVLDIDPGRFLYPLIKSWPVASITAETILVERSGDEVLFLNDVRHQAGTALTLRRPLTDRNMPAVRAALGQEGIFAGRDYRGIAVLAATRIIHGSPWAIAAKIDLTEVYRPIKTRAWVVVLSGLVLTLTASLLLYLLRLKEIELHKHQQLEEHTLALKAMVKARTAELELERDNLKGILDATYNGVYIVNQQMKIEYANPALLQDFGPIEGRTCHEYLYGTPGICSWCNNLEVFSGKTVHREWTSGITGKTYSSFDTLYKKAGGEICKLALLHDVTAQKIAEKTIKDHNEELEQRVIERTRSLEDAIYELNTINAELELRRGEAEEAQKKLQQLSSAVVNSPTSVVITDHLGRIEYVNPKFTEITGYMAEEAIGQNPRILNAGVQSEELYRTLWDTIQSGLDWRGDLCNRKKNGELYWEHISISPIRNEQGETTHFVAIKEDITEDKRIAEELQIAQAAAHASNRAKSEFLANMSHEIRTPLNAIIGFSALALKGRLPPRQQDYIGKIHTAGELLLNIINDILDFSKIEAGQMKMEQISFRLDIVIANASGIVQENALGKGLNLKLKTVPEAAACLVGDPHRLTQIIVNLLNNAVKFTERGEVSLEASLLAQKNDRVHLQFTVRDTGIGISAEQIDKLFQPFIQADGSTTRNFSGTGLGLSISRQLTELMGGEIWCESTPGEGSIFSFTAWFGVCQESDLEQCVPVCTTNSGYTELSSVFSDSRILLVEDNEINQQLTIELLKDTGAVVEVAANGEEAVTMITNGSTGYDLVLMDIQMPIMNGYEAARLVRADGRFAHLPIIAMTAHAMEEERQKIIEAGIDAHITKPIDVRTMLQVMKLFLRKRESSAHPNEKLEDNNGVEITIPDIAGLDSAAALVRIDGDRKLYLWVLRTFVENESHIASEIEAALGVKDTKLALRHVHTIKSTAGAIGADELKELAQSLENAIIKGESSANATEILERFAAKLNRLVADISTHVSPPLQVDNDTTAGTVDMAVVTLIFNRLLKYIDGMDGKAELYLDDFHEELAGLPIVDIEKITSYLKKFEFTAARQALMAFSARNGIVLTVDGRED